MGTDVYKLTATSSEKFWLSTQKKKKAGIFNHVVFTAENDYSERVSREIHILRGVKNLKLSDPEDERPVFLRRFGKYLPVFTP